MCYPYIKEDKDSFEVEIVKIDEGIILSLDTIVNNDNECKYKDFFWYLNVEYKGDTIVYALSTDHIERLNDFAKNRGEDKGLDKALMINGKLVFLVDPYRKLKLETSSCNIKLRNPKSLDKDGISFSRYSTWLFFKYQDKSYFAYKNSVRCN